MSKHRPRQEQSRSGDRQTLVGGPGTDIPDARVHTVRSAIQEFAEEAALDDAVQEIWARIGEDRVDIWVLTDPIDPDRELRLYEGEDILHEHLPDFDAQVHVEHSGLYDTTNYLFRPAVGAELIRHIR